MWGNCLGKNNKELLVFKILHPVPMLIIMGKFYFMPITTGSIGQSAPSVLQQESVKPQIMIEKITIDETDILLEDIAPEKGKIIVTNSYGNNYSCYWGAMGGDLKAFITGINPDYFASKLMGADDENEMDVDATFAEVRKFIKKDMCLAWYEHREFQKHMREVLNDFQRSCKERPDDRYFVDAFTSLFINRLNFRLIDDKYDEARWKNDFENISEPWHFIQNRPNAKYKWLVNLHGKLVKKIKAPTPLMS